MWNFKSLFKSRPQSIDTQYVEIPDTAFNENLKKEIQKLESYAEELAGRLQKKYSNEFEKKNRKNLKVCLERDIDGDEVEGISSDDAFEKEYRSVLAVKYDDFEDDEQDVGLDISLWYYYGGYRHGTGGLYKLAHNNLESEMEEALKELLERFHK